MPENLENSAVATVMEKISFHYNPKEGQCQRVFKLSHNALISHGGKVMLQILQARLQCKNLHMYSLDLEKSEKPKIKLLTSIGS